MMKKFFLIVALVASCGLNSKADEGMWLLPMLQKINAGAIRDLGCRLSPEQIYSINNSSLKDAVVIFGRGCTAEVISDRGLLVTNHHCGYSTIQSLSSPEHNYLEDGFWAMNLKEEIPAPGLSVTFLEKMEDVTDEFEGLSSEKAEAKKVALVEKAEKENPGCKVLVQDFYDNNIFYLIIYKVYKDIRLVGTPPASMGKFGGETDNWMWPRHTCDFSMFRIYAGADNAPADYSPDNQPLSPKRSLKVSLKGYNEGDYAMIIGYPGSTQRYETATQLTNMLRNNDIRIDARTIRQDIMWKAMRADETVSLQYASKYAMSSNGWKKWQGERKCFADLDVIGREKQKEAEFAKWAAKNAKQYIKAVAAVDKCSKTVQPAKEEFNKLNETLGKIELTSIPVSMVSAIKSAKDSATALQEAKAAAAKFYKDYNAALDKDVAKALFKHYMEVSDPKSRITLPGTNLKQLDIDAYVDNLFEKSAFTSEQRMQENIKEASDIYNDPAMILGSAIRSKLMEIFGRVNNESKALEEASQLYTAGMLKWKEGQALYPDANFTMRLTYGTVKPYLNYAFYTTFDEMIAKEQPGNYEFRVPEKVKEVYAGKDFGDYALPDGKVPACFITNCDITGGNSGSPVMDAEGNLIGLAFDGNWESMSSDVIFEPNLQRCICVDIRYVLLMMDKVGGAGYLREEMNIVK